jgi:D-alanyl-lipoteichoic acid acyltransferase DltB (MBOAT superfamily)
VNFISVQFATFLAAVAFVYFCLPYRVRWVWLLAASLGFYATYEPVYLVQILAASAATYFFAIKLEAETDKRRKVRLLAVSIGLLVVNLLVFKYTWFFNETARALVNVFGVEYPVPVIRILLPIGISFYTLQLISYLVDVFRGEKAERHFGFFALYVALFPKLIAGPIERARNLLPQLKADHALDYARVASGLQLIAWGVFKKAVVADRIAPIVASVYDAPKDFEGVSLAFATWLYAFQIYFDFSGYTDIALGVALVLGFKLTQNFNRPYFATSIQDFWKRWHISLTSWLTDYVFNPLIRSKFIRIKWYNLMLLSMLATFLVSGFWHGAQWTFVAWGALHGSYIVIALMMQKPFNAFVARIGLTARPRLYRGLKIAFTFTLVCFAYILFRANSMADALYIISHLHTGWGDVVGGLKATVNLLREEFMLAIAGIAIVMGVEVLKGFVDVPGTFASRPAVVRWGVYYAAALSIVLFGAFYSIHPQFIYFRF